MRTSITFSPVRRFLSLSLAALAFLFAASASAQEYGPRNFLGVRAKF
jgi:hypothetical protein